MLSKTFYGLSCLGKKLDKLNKLNSRINKNSPDPNKVRGLAGADKYTLVDQTFALSLGKVNELRICIYKTLDSPFTYLLDARIWYKPSKLDYFVCTKKGWRVPIINAPNIIAKIDRLYKKYNRKQEKK